ncbi:MAG: trypsin-like peptidase domain-containing protein [bacterium]
MSAQSIRLASLSLLLLTVASPLHHVCAFESDDIMVPLIQKARQGIVNIEAKIPMTDKMGRFGQALQSHFEDNGLSNPKWYVSMGSGVIWSKDGYIVTTKSVVKTSNDISVRLLNGETHSARLVGADDVTNIAVLRLDADQLKNVRPIAHRTKKLHEGSSLLLMGYGYGGIPTISAGLAGMPPEDFDPSRHWFQFTAPLRPGNSGSALVDSNGNLAGIALGREEDLGFNAVIKLLTGQKESNVPQSQIMSYSSLGVGIPINYAARIVEQIIHTGKVVRGWIGVSVRPFPVNSSHDEHTLQIVRIIPGSPAEEAGLQIGDTMLCVDGVDLTDPESLGRIIQEYSPGTRVNIDFSRNNVNHRTELTVIERPDLRE